MEPEIPRIIFDSEHGFSQIVVSQVSCSLNVAYSPDWQAQIENGRNYLLGRTPLLFDLLEIAGVHSPHFCGLVTQVQMSSAATDEAIIEHLGQTFLKEVMRANTHDLEVKITKIVSDRYFSNISIGNYRTWSVETPAAGIQRLSRQDAAERGVRILADFNDRYSFNESLEHVTTRSAIGPIINGGLQLALEAIGQIGGRDESINDII
jgi:hypothetical protein